MLVPDAVLKEFVYHYGIVSVSSEIINAISAKETTFVVSNRIISSSTSLEVVRGCDGAGVSFLLIAAIVAFPSSFRRKSLGISIVLVLVYIVNQIRVTGVFFIIGPNPDWFDFFHTFVAPSLIVVLATNFFIWWTKWAHHNDS